MIYVVRGIKGGSGKTTVATNLTVALVLEGRDVLLVDADEQETATDFSAWRNERMGGSSGYTAVQFTGPAARGELKRLAGKYQDVVIDTGGRDTTSQRAALSVANVYLVPFNPRSFDIWTIEKRWPTLRYRGWVCSSFSSVCNCAIIPCSSLFSSANTS